MSRTFRGNLRDAKKTPAALLTDVTYGQEMGYSVTQVAMRAGHDPSKWLRLTVRSSGLVVGHGGLLDVFGPKPVVEVLRARTVSMSL